jgi:pyridoxine kinase
LEIYFKSFYSSDVIKEKIDSSVYYLLEDLKNKQRAFNFQIEDQCIKIKDKFKYIFYSSLTDLSGIEEEEWKECKKSYYKAKKLLLSINELETEKGEGSKRLLTFQDISCFGQSSSSATIPILSALGIQTAILPRVLLSNPDSKFFTGFYSIDLINNIPKIIDQWLKNKISFDAFYTDNITKHHIPYIIEIIEKLAKPDCLTIIDPSMTDNDELNTIINPIFKKEIVKLFKKADYILPNITEACLLLDIPYIKENYDRNFIEKISIQLAKFGAKNIIITGISFEKGKIGASIYHSESGTFEYYFNEFIEAHFHGIGNIFSSTFTGAILNGKTDIESIKLAADFAVEVIKNTNNDKKKDKNGIKFEKSLLNLIKAFEKSK